MDLIKRQGLWGLVALLSLYMPLGFADNTTNQTSWQQQWFNNPEASNWFVGIDGGAVWPILNDKTTISNNTGFPSPNDIDTYTINAPNVTGAGSLYFGYRWERPSGSLPWLKSSAWLPYYSVGLRYQHVDGFNVNGDIQEFSLEPSSYSYQLKVSGFDVFSAFAKVDIYEWKKFAPYISFGIGTVGNIKVSDYSETPINGTTQPRNSPAFQNHSLPYNFMFTVGTGLDYFITPQLWASLGYEYADYQGDITTGNGTSNSIIGDWRNESLSLGNLTSNTVLLGLSYRLP